MKARHLNSLLALSAIILQFSTTAFAQGPLAPPAGPPVASMRTLDQIDPRTPVGVANTPGTAAASHAITAPGSYFLTGNVAAVGKACAIDVVTTGAVTLDLRGFTLSGGTAATLRSSASARLSLLGGMIDATGAPNAVSAAGDLTATSLRLRGSGQTLVAAAGSFRMDRCQLDNSPSGISAISPASHVSDCDFDQIAGTAITLSGPAASVFGCRFTRCGPPANGSGIINLRGLAQQVNGNHFGPSAGPVIHATTQGHEIRGNQFHLTDSSPALFSPGPRVAFRDNTYYCPSFPSGRDGGTDGGGNVSLAANAAPTAVISGPSTSIATTPISLSGAASFDTDGDTPLTYTWTIVQRPAAGVDLTVNGASATLPASGASHLAAGIYRFRLVVTDTEGLASSPYDIQISVVANPAPTAVLDLVTVSPRVSITCQMTGARSSASAPGGVVSYTFSLTSRPSGSTIPLNIPIVQSTPAFSFTPDRAGIFQWSLVVTDDVSTNSSATFLSITVTN